MAHQFPWFSKFLQESWYVRFVYLWTDCGATATAKVKVYLKKVDKTIWAHTCRTALPQQTSSTQCKGSRSNNICVWFYAFSLCSFVCHQLEFSCKNTDWCLQRLRLCKHILCSPITMPWGINDSRCCGNNNCFPTAKQVTSILVFQ